jgi:hypothetical protein
LPGKFGPIAVRTERQRDRVEEVGLKFHQPDLFSRRSLNRARCPDLLKEIIDTCKREGKCSLVDQAAIARRSRPAQVNSILIVCAA